MIALTTKQQRSSRGFTLIELVITIAILSIALLAVAQSLQFSAQFGADSLWQTKTVELVQAYSDEILTKKYDHNTPAGGSPACDTVSAAACSGTLGAEGAEQRGGGVNDFNDVDDYHAISDNPPIDALGNVRTEYQGYQVDVTVSYAGAELGLASGNSAKRVEIVITPPGQPSVPFSVYRSNF